MIDLRTFDRAWRERLSNELDGVAGSDVRAGILGDQRSLDDTADPEAIYRWTLEMFRRIRRRNTEVSVKSGLMLGLGETTDELLDTLADLLDVGVRMLTLGQYLRPSLDQLPVVRFLEPKEFDELRRAAQRMGFEQVAAGPFVRSSYHAREMIRKGGACVGKE